jgi:hypothetical protein
MHTQFIRTSSLSFVAALLMFPLWTVSGHSNRATPKTITGEVTDTICAPSGSHAAMIAKMPNMGRDSATCAKQCARIGGKYAVIDDSTKRVYTVEDQSKVQAFAGQKVRVTGTLQGNKINVTDVNQLS